MCNVIIKQTINGKATEVTNQWQMSIEHLPKYLCLKVSHKVGGNTDRILIPRRAGVFVIEQYPRTYYVEVVE